MKNYTRMMADEVFESRNERGNLVTIDMRKSPEKANLGPTELVLAALSACGAVDIAAMLKKRKKTIVAFDIESDATRQETPPRYITKAHCTYKVTSPDVTEEELYKTAKLAIEKYCSVASSLKSEITFSVEVIRP